MIVHHLTEQYKRQVWELLKLADFEFIPPLSARHSTIQGNLLIDGKSVSEEPVEYFEELKQQQFLLYIVEEEVIGFISYIPDHSLKIPDVKEISLVNYISTVIVHPSFRGDGIAEKLYRELMKETKLPLATRTWSTNYVHIHVLNKLQFDVVAILKNDRENTIDTIYLMKYL